MPISQTKHEQQQRALQRKVYDLLVELGGQMVTEEQGINYIPGTAIGLPTEPQPMTLAQGAKLLTAAAANQEKRHRFERTFRFRPWDGANALQVTLKRIYGTSGEGATTYSFFGPNPPEMLQVEVDVNKEISVPWGAIDFPLLDARLYLGAEVDERYGELFKLIVEAPKKHRSAIEGLFAAIAETLKTDSIYKGKAFVGVRRPTFFDPFRVKRHRVVYHNDVFTRLENTVWGVLRYHHLLLSEDLPVNNKVLLHGPYGTGKSLALALTAQEALEQGWTFIQCHTGKDNLEQVMQTAALYAPCVVGVEDIDVLAQAQDEKENTKLLELFDGISVKNNQIMVVMTSNVAGELHKGMLRAGRIDATIEIGALDEPGVERLIKVNVGDRLAAKIDWKAVHKAMEGYEPAFIAATFSSAQKAAIIRTGSLEHEITTADLVAAATVLRPQHDLHSQAKTKPEKTELEESFGTFFRSIVVDELDHRKVDLDRNIGSGKLLTMADKK